MTANNRASVTIAFQEEVLTRLVRALRAAGLEVRRCEVNVHSGNIVLHTNPIVAPAKSTADDGNLSSLNMRRDSKKHRVWMATEKLLEDNGKMHIDEMLRTIGSSELFANIRNRRARFSNLLSQYKALHFIDSDNSGNYWLVKKNINTIL
jgi:hypothetical protein